MVPAWKSKRTAIGAVAFAVLLCGLFIVSQIVSGSWFLVAVLVIVAAGFIAFLIYTIRRPWPWFRS